MSDSSFRGITPVTARSSLPPESVAFLGRSNKIRLRVVSRHPLPEHHFLAPFDYHDAECFQKLQRFAHSHLLARTKVLGHDKILQNTSSEHLVFQMDSFEIPFDDPEILRDGDTIQVHLDQRQVTSTADQGEERSADTEEESNNAVREEQDDMDDGSDEQEYQSTDSLEKDARDAEERNAILEATRVAALLRAGIHTNEDDDADVLPARLVGIDDLPRMPGASSFDLHRAAKSVNAKASDAKPACPTPTMPMMSLRTTGGASAAMAAFEAKRKQLQRSSGNTSTVKSGSASRLPPSAAARMSAVQAATKRSRDLSSSSSSSDSTGPSDSSSDSASDSDLISAPISSSDNGSSSSSDSSSSRSDSDSDSDSDPVSHSDSDSDSSDEDTQTSDSAPSVQHTRSDRRRAAARAEEGESSDASESQFLIPPGQGTNRTKRRNQMRRKKLQLLRDAENFQAFSEAKQRAAQRERGATADDDDSSAQKLAWVEDRKPSYQIRVARSALASASDEISSSDIGNSFPPGGGSLDLVSPVLDVEAPSSTKAKSNNCKKRKRDGDTTNTVEDAATYRRGPTLDGAKPGVAPYDGSVPAGMSIRHVDCQTYYENELVRLEAEAEASHALEDEDDEPTPSRDTGQRCGNRVNGQHGQTRHNYHGEHATKDSDHIDYGSPDAAEQERLDQMVPRKKIKVEEPCDELAAKNWPSSERHSNASTACSERSDGSFKAVSPHHTCLDPEELAEGIRVDVPRSVKEASVHADATWERLFREFKPSTLSGMNHVVALGVDFPHMKPGLRLLWEELVLHPIMRVPAAMYFVGVVRTVGSQEGAKGTVTTVGVDKIGPLLPNDETDWADYEMETVHWKREECPNLWVIE
ncbi:uncharacterized protein MEPE_04476 [Melanopsichium pennsylvanicum]|uniref:Uncharacterized protein n=2 Tax=Melanopsichium pennsylvanicum TaxID=63383 RepID=A0AAJ4XPZ7_9BASI|nr:hypothetical protein BN887_05711 [Melanopsichium pennsylvanicum 4]SNX85767.1 uncharacterized protein MEPE_04476 [Melanopsichium pennsylvanicum]